MIEERRHPPGPERWWTETWCFEFGHADGAVTGLACLTLLPNQQQAWYWSWVLRPGEPLVHVADLTVQSPRRTLEIRAPELWADHICEEPGERWTIGNEANASSFDDPHEALGRGLGGLVPLGFDLEWEAAGPAAGYEAGYEVPATVHGEVLVGAERLELAHPGRWWHRWGVNLPVASVPPSHGPWAGLTLDLDGERIPHVLVPHPDGTWHPPLR